MRRAIIATAGTAAALVALLSYKSSNALKVSKVAVNPGSSVTITTPTATSPSTSVATTSPTSSTGSSTTGSSTTGSSATGASTTGPSTSSSSTEASATRSVTGTDVQYNYGDVQLRITTTAGKITAIDIANESAPDGRSQSINSQALPILVSEALAAQGVNIDVVSGATFTSQAFAQALRSALEADK